MAVRGQRADLIDHGAHRYRARIAAAVRDDAEGAAVIAAVLHLHEHPRQAFLKSFQQMRRHLAHRHDVGNRDLFAGFDAESRIERGARIAPGLAPHLVVIADDAIDFFHASKHFRLSLRRAAGDDDPRRRPLALQPADRLPRLRHGFVGDRAAVDDDGIGEPGVVSLTRDHFGFKGVEAAAEGDEFDAHGQATDANSAGSNRPSYSKAAVPVISTRSSPSRRSATPPSRRTLSVPRRAPRYES